MHVLSIDKKIRQLQNQMIQYNIGGYLISSCDEFNGEYVADYAKRITFISGFTGSNGIILITLSKCYLFTDGRYTIQAINELGNYFDICEIKQLYSIIQNINIESYGLDPEIFTIKTVENLQKYINITLFKNLVDDLWHDQPLRPHSFPYLLDHKYHGEDFTDKNVRVKNTLQQKNVTAFFTSDYHSICWLLNIRGNDLEYTPIIQMMMLWMQSKIIIFTYDISRFKNIQQYFSDIVFVETHDMYQYFNQLENNLLLDKNEINYAIYQKLSEKHIHLIYDDNPIILLKSIKNQYEIKALRSAQQQDSIAINLFIEYIRNNNLAQETEFTLQDKLKFFRAQRKNYISLSFASIIGFNENGAIIHYQPTQVTAKKIDQNGLLLFDSGSQYLGATTDVTRTMSVGIPTEHQKLLYTLVLKGHIALIKMKFPYGTTGKELDTIARQFLWQYGYNYNHSTGHGVGSGLSVHEGPQSISINSNIRLEPNMILTNEPGVYLQGEFGIRLENMLLVTQYSEKYLCFENLTYISFDKQLFAYEILSNEELEWLDKYESACQQQI